MIKRLVLWKVIGDSTGEKMNNAMKLKYLLESLNGNIPGMIQLEAGINFADSSDGSDVALSIEFKDMEALAIFKHHPAHEKIKAAVSALREERRVVDYKTGYE